jgi:hypothetical protein
MEILALLGMPKVVADDQSEERHSRLFYVSSVTNTINADVNQPGAHFNAQATMDSTGRFQYAFGVTIPAGAFTLNGGTYDRSVLGFRVVTKGGYRGELTTNPFMYIYATVKPGTGNNQIGGPVPYAPHLSGDEGQYFEIVTDWKTGTFWIYIDGAFVTKWAFAAPTGIDNAYPILIRLYADQNNIPYAQGNIVGHVRDLYMGSLGVGEVFEPLGDLKVDQLLTTAHTLFSNNTLTTLNNWGAAFSTTLDQAGTKLYTQNYADPTPLKTADYVYGQCAQVTGLGYIEVSSNGAKIAGDTKPTLLPTTRVLKINPADVGNDLTVSFKIDP